MKKIVLYTVVVVALFAVVGCQDFLEYKQYGKPTSDQFWKTEEDAISARNALTNWTAREGIDGRGHMWLENCSDNLVTGRPQTEAERIKNFIMTPHNGRGWKHNYGMMYQIIGIANGILTNVPGMNISDEVKNNVVGEAHFWRAFSYLWLAPWYADNGPNGGLPIVTEKTPVDDLDQKRPKSVLENYKLIIEDLKKAGELLPLFSQVPNNEKGRPHKAAAWGFAARAALYAAQYDEKYYSVVLEMTKKIMELGGADKRELYNDFSTLFSEKNNFSSEYIYSMLGNSSDGPKFAGMSFQKDGYGWYNTWGYFQPTWELYKAYEKGDKRRKATILLPGEDVKFIGRDVIYGIWPQGYSSSSGMTFKKWMSPFAPANAPGNTINANGNNASTRMGLPIMRYADVLLMRAEALIWTTGEGNGEAKALLNKIRVRAGLPANSNATKAQLKNERRCELAFEFLPSRFIDLVRWKDYAKLQQPLHGIKVVYDSIPIPGNKEGKKKARIVELKGKDGKPLVDALTGKVKKGPILKKMEKIEIWGARSFDPNKNHVFPIPAKNIVESKNLKQNTGY